MNWEAVGAIGQVFAGIIVMISLIYLAIQVRQANKHAVASSEVEWFNGWNRILEGWVESRETIAALQNGFQDFDALPASQQAIFQMRVGGMVNHWVLATRLKEKGLISEDIQEVCTEVLISFLSTPGGLQYWRRDADATPNGLELLAKIESGTGALPKATELFPWWGPDGMADMLSTGQDDA